jgi:nicotinamide mononucleotide transporter
VSVLDWLRETAFTLLGAPTTWAEVIGFSSGVLVVWLVVVQHVWNWPVGILNNLMFFALFMTSGLYADGWLQVFYLALSVYGWWAWLRGGERHSRLAVSRTSAREWLALLAAGLASTALLTWILAAATNSTVPLPDALTTVLSLLATWGQARKKLESWWLWLAADLIYVPLYAYKNLWLTAILFFGFMVLCGFGLRSWTRDYRAAGGRSAALATGQASGSAPRARSSST